MQHLLMTADDSTQMRSEHSTSELQPFGDESRPNIKLLVDKGNVIKDEPPKEELFILLGITT
jgi:hypothetical protein